MNEKKLPVVEKKDRLASLFEGKGDDWINAIKEFFSMDDVAGKTELTSTDIRYLTLVEVLSSVIKSSVNPNFKVLDIFVETYKINMISHKRKSREEFIQAMKYKLEEEQGKTGLLKKLTGL